MIGYSCKYTPIELLCALGATPRLIDDEVQNFEYAETHSHATLCSHAKALLEHSGSFDEMVLVNCCDAVRRIYDVLDLNKRHPFLHFIDLPHADNECAHKRYKSELIRLKESYCAQFHTAFNIDIFSSSCAASVQKTPGVPYVAVMGARVSRELFAFMKQKIGIPLVDLTCNGNRSIGAVPDEVNINDFDALMDWYAGRLLGMLPCMRMTDIAGRKQLIEDENLRGILYNTVKFCDYYAFDYSRLEKESSLPILKFESDFTPQARGQLTTRLEAFQESLIQSVKTIPGKEKPKTQTLYAGIDSGSTTTNMAVLNGNKEILASIIVRTGAKAQNGALMALEAVCKALHVGNDAFACIVATGYGRSHISFATDTKTEISCHAKGAHFLCPQARTIIDIGGQDSKVICMDGEGKVTNFMMNDKCAAGTGRFLEMMARTLEVEIEEMSRLGLKWSKDITISSMCSVFAESEVISLIAENHSAEDIVHGLNKSVAARTASMVTRAKGAAPYAMTGGVARNGGVVAALEYRLSQRIMIPDAPDLCGAIGAALLGMDG